eukprot:COSAG01_NODE_4418_length_5045_cov_1.022038_4_plen_84_part_00
MTAMRQGASIKVARQAVAPLVKMLGEPSNMPYAIDHPILHIDDAYIMGELMGTGQVGKVFRAQHRETGCAISLVIGRQFADDA